MLGLADTGMGRALPVGGSPLNLQDQLHVLQSQVIREAAEKGRCIIVGRAADYILRKRRDCLNVFILSDPEHRKQRAIELGAPPEDVEKVLRKKDKDHASHYRHYTEQVWGDPKNYHLSLHSGKLGYDLCCDLIIAAAELF